MMNADLLKTLLQIAGIGQLLMVAVTFIVVPKAIGSYTELRRLPRLHRQMYMSYSSYVAGTIVALGLLSIVFPDELISGKGLGRSIAFFCALFWGGRFVLQFFYEIKPFLQSRSMVVSSHLLTGIFLLLTLIYFGAGLSETTIHE